VYLYIVKITEAWVWLHPELRDMKTFLTVKLAVLPFAVFWLLLGNGHPGWAIWSGLGLSLAGNLWQLFRREIVMLEVGELALFALFVLAQLSQPDWVATNALWLSFAGLGAISLTSVLLGRPWTADYSRAAYPENADTPQFFVINTAISVLWGILFLALGFCRLFGVSAWISHGIVIVGALISIFGPRLAIRFLLRRMREARETFRWRAPDFFRGKTERDCDVAIVGAGVGGLTAAALLADAGLKVMLFDQHVVPGGYCHTYLRKAHHDNRPVLYRFDAGPYDFSGVWPGGPISGVLDRLGVAGRLQWKRVTHSYCLAGRQMDIPADWRDYVRQLCEQFPSSADGIRTLFETIHAIFEGMFSTGRERSGIPGMPDTIEGMLAFPKDHPQAARWMSEPFDKLVAAHVSDPDVVRFLNALSGYLGDGSERLTCAQMVPIFGYYFKGGHYPVGGSGAFADVLADAIRQRGGDIRLKSEVSRILVEKGHASGVVLGNGQTIRAAAVVSNADIRRTFLELVEPQELPADFRARVAAAEPANSAFSVQLGLDCEPDIQSVVHIDTPIDLGLGMMSKLDPSAAPVGHSTLSLISILPYAESRDWFPPTESKDWKDWRRSADYEARKQRLGDQMIEAAETVIPGLRNHIVYRADASPVTYARYDWASSGAIYGVSREGRLKGTKSPVQNLVIAGSGNAGSGVEAAVISGAEAAEALLPGLLARSEPG